MKNHNSKDHVEKNTLINLFKKGDYKKGLEFSKELMLKYPKSSDIFF